MNPILHRKPGRKAFLDDPVFRGKLEVLLSDPALTVPAIAQRLGVALSTVEKAIARLKRESETAQPAQNTGTVLPEAEGRGAA